MRNTLFAVALAAVALAGASAAHAQGQIVIVNMDGPNEGFNDPTPAPAAPGNPALTVGAQRLFIFEHAAGIWESVLNPTVDIVVNAQFNPLGVGVLGSAGTTAIFTDFPGAEYPGMWYFASLAKHLSGTDLNPLTFDINAQFSSQTAWYHGTDNNEGTLTDLLPVVLHELGHGLGFANLVNEATGTLNGGLPDIYSQYTLDVDTNKIWNEMTNAERATSAVNTRKVSWNGVNVNRQVPFVLHRGEPQLRVVFPAGLGPFLVGPAGFGGQIVAPGITAPAVLVNDGVGVTSDGCEPLAPGSANGLILLIDRGTCTFVIKVTNAQNAGALAVIVADNAVGTPPAALGGADPSITIPSARVTQADGNTLKANLAGLRLTLGVDTAVLSGMDRVQRLMMLNSVIPVALGSSISHYEPIAIPNQLMEPAINSDLTSSVQAPQDLSTALLTDIGWFSDRDGTPDGKDHCIGSDLRQNVFVGTCDAQTNNIMLPPGGCTLSDELRACEAASTSRAQYLACVNHHTSNWVRWHFITRKNQQSIKACAAQVPDEVG
jgi:PA domain